MKPYNIEKILTEAEEQLYVECASCGNCNGRECGRINVRLSLTHDDFRDVFGDQIHSLVLAVGNMPYDKDTSIKKVLDKFMKKS